jgi:hypothetical protein
MRYAALAALALAGGCFVVPQPASSTWGDPSGVIGGRTAEEEREFRAMSERGASGWGESGGVIGGRSAFEAGSVKAAGSSRADVASLEQEVRVLSARVERLERLVGSGGSGTAVAAAPAAASLTVYQVSPDGQTAWVSSGTTSGISQGQTFQVRRAGENVAQVQAARVWPKVTELSVLWANGPLKRGDSVVPSTK